MAERPVIMVVDDEPAALAAMLDALTRRFGGDYRIVPHFPHPLLWMPFPRSRRTARKLHWSSRTSGCPR
jgi:hypothetical protein